MFHFEREMSVVFSRTCDVATNLKYRTTSVAYDPCIPTKQVASISFTDATGNGVANKFLLQGPDGYVNSVYEKDEHKVVVTGAEGGHKYTLTETKDDKKVSEKAMNWLTYFLIFFAICIVWFVITRIWINGIDMIISALKKMLRLNKNDSTESWHTLEDIRDKTKKD